MQLKQLLSMLLCGSEAGHLPHGITTVKPSTYGLRDKMIPKLDAIKKSTGRYNAALPLVSEPPENAGCEKRNRRNAHNGGASRRIKNIGCAQTNNRG